MKLKELLAGAGFQTGGGLKSIAAGAALAWSMSTAQRTATEAAEVAMEAEDRYGKAVAAYEDVKRQQDAMLNGVNEYISDQIGEGLYDRAVLARVRSLGWMPPMVDNEEFDEGIGMSYVDELPTALDSSEV